MNFISILRFKICLLKKINLSDYNYHLPESRIATYGLVQRDQSKLLYFNKDIEHHQFYELPDLLPPGSTLFFNNTKVIQARLILKRQTGALIEVFLLNPVKAQEEIFDTLKSKGPVLYHCMIGNLKKWRDSEILNETIVINGRRTGLSVQLVDREKKHVQFSWDNHLLSFSDILESIGHTPLPPYINRPDEDKDKERYQTVYSKNPGAVAAPTAGLHFTKEILEKLDRSGFKTDFLTLHVSAGTFQPIKVDDIVDHPMHREQVIINRLNLENVINASSIIPVGTTAMRTLESTYWYGVKLINSADTTFHIDKLYPYDYHVDLPSRQQAFTAVHKHMQENDLEVLIGETEIFIFPGYDFKVCNGLITNFHQPGSTLILLVAALVGDEWLSIYNQALENDYRFLSYGDSSLLLR